MSCKAIQVLISPSQQDNPSRQPTPGPPDWVEDALRERLRRVRDNLPVDDPMPHRAHELVKVGENDSETPTHVRAGHHIPDSADLTQHIQSIESDMTADAKWYRIRSHECTHDEGSGRACGEWQVEAEQGSVPDGLPGG